MGPELRSAPVHADVCADLRSIIDRVGNPRIRGELENIRAKLAAEPVHSPYPLPSALSERELETLRYVALGLANACIADRMGLVPGTVKAYLRSVMRKLDCVNRIEAVNAARALGYDL